jgi:hypothetical protein
MSKNNYTSEKLSDKCQKAKSILRNVIACFVIWLMRDFYKQSNRALDCMDVLERMDERETTRHLPVSLRNTGDQPIVKLSSLPKIETQADTPASAYPQEIRK